jgi:hypothetical protein
MHDVSTGRIRRSFDLLTAVMHRLGHVLGLDDDYFRLASDSVMNGWLAPGVSRERTVAEGDRLFVGEFLR